MHDTGRIIYNSLNGWKTRTLGHWEKLNHWYQ